MIKLSRHASTTYERMAFVVKTMIQLHVYGTPTTLFFNGQGISYIKEGVTEVDPKYKAVFTSDDLVKAYNGDKKLGSCILWALDRQKLAFPNCRV